MLMVQGSKLNSRFGAFKIKIGSDVMHYVVLITCKKHSTKTSCMPLKNKKQEDKLHANGKNTLDVKSIN